MRVQRPVRPVLGLVTLVLAPAAFGFGFPYLVDTWGNAIVATDTTEAGRALTPPSPGHPVYFLGRSLGTRLGSIGGDDEPGEAKFDAFVARVLAKQGYLPAEPGVHDPTMFLVVQWGYLTPETENLQWFLGYHPSQDIGRSGFPGIIGPELRWTNFRSRTVEAILYTARIPIYGIIITAFEYGSARTPHPVVYWQTRIGLPANGKSMAQALPAIVAAAGPEIGRTSDKSALVSTDGAREGEVQFGELKVIGLVPDLALPEKPVDRRK